MNIKNKVAIGLYVDPTDLEWMNKAVKRFGLKNRGELFRKLIDFAQHDEEQFEQFRPQEVT